MAQTKQVVIARSNPVSPDPRVEKTARALCEAGYPVTIVGWDRSGKAPQREKSDFATIWRLRIPAQFGKGIGNLPALLRWQVGLLRWLWRNKTQFEIIHVCDFDTVLPALIIRTLTKKIVIYDIFDFYAEMLRATPLIFKRIIRVVDLWAIGQADALILADEVRLQQIEGSRPRSVTIVYNTPEDYISQTVEVNIQRPPESKLHITFVGLLHVERGLLELLDVLSRHPEWTLDLAGFGGDEDLISKRAMDMDNVRLHGRVSYPVAMTLSRLADVFIGTYDPSIPNHRFASPNKLFEAMMLGKPIIVARGTNMDRIVEKACCGIVINYGDVIELESALAKLARNPELRTQLGVASRSAYEMTYSWDRMKERLLDLYASYC